MNVVLPGDKIQDASTSTASVVKLGPGLLQLQQAASTQSAVISTHAGLLGHQKPKDGKEGPTESWWVESQGRRYTPSTGEPVLGVITARFADGYRVDIGSSQTANLDALAFEGATKRSKPNLKVGTLVYARVSFAQPFTEPEIECFDPQTQKAQGFGELQGGTLVRNIELQRCRELLSPSTKLLPDLGRRFPFEVAIGYNGRAWVKSGELARTVELVQKIKGRP